jgi:hypothetical protein
VAFIKIRGFLKAFSENGGFNKKSETFSMIKRFFEGIFNGTEASLKRCKDFWM